MTRKISERICRPPTSSDGRVYHLGLLPTQASNLLILLGPEERARLFGQLLTERLEIKSPRGFLTITGWYKDCRISIVSIGMGFPLMDMALRELRSVVQPGPMVVLRVGTCGVIKKDVENVVGRVLITDLGVVLIQKNYNNGNSGPPYFISKKWMPDAELTEILKAHTVSSIGADNLLSSLDASADSFYSSQGRCSLGFQDHNEDLVDRLLEMYKDAPNISMEMETGQLIFASRAQTDETHRIHAAAMHIAVADRTVDSFQGDTREWIEAKLAAPALDTLVDFAKAKGLSA